MSARSTASRPRWSTTHVPAISRWCRLPAQTDLRRRIAATIAGFGALTLLVCVAAPLVGTTSIHLSRVFDRTIPFADNVDAQVFFVARLPRVLAAILVGSSLAVAGVVFQAFLRNPLASPDTLGLSAGATLGAVIVITFHIDTAVLGVSAVPIASFLGAAIALGIVYAMSVARRHGTSSTVLLLAGVALSASFGALNRLIQVIGDYTDTFRSIRWMMGSLDVGSYTDVAVAVVPIAAALIAVATLPRVLDLVSLGAAAAESRGVDVRRAERVALVSASVLTGSAGFLGGALPFLRLILPPPLPLVVGAGPPRVPPAPAAV